MKAILVVLLCFFSFKASTQDTYQTISFLDSVEQALKIKVGMSPKDFAANNSNISKELFKPSKTLISKGGSRKSHQSSKLPEVLSLVFDDDKLTSYSIRIPCSNSEDGPALFKKYKDLIKSRASSSYIMYDRPTYIEVKHPTARWYYFIQHDPQYHKDKKCGVDVRIVKRDIFF